MCCRAYKPEMAIVPRDAAIVYEDREDLLALVWAILEVDKRDKLIVRSI